jgi:hypothetical protein
MYSSQIIILGIQVRRMRWAGRVAHTGIIGIPLPLTGVEVRVALSVSSNSEPTTHKVISITNADLTLQFLLQELFVQLFLQFILHYAILA